MPGIRPKLLIHPFLAHLVTNEYPCLYCGNASRDVFAHATSGDGLCRAFVRCSRCAAVTLTPPPSPAELSAAYSDIYYGESETKFWGPTEQVIDQFRARRAQSASRWLKAGDRVLDIGCGNGRFLNYLQRFGKYDLNGVELPGKAADRAKKIPNLKIKEGVFQPNDFPEASLKLVTMFHVFEHLPNPRETLTAIRQSIASNGRLIVSFPNIESWQAKLFRGHWLHLDPPRHLALYGTKSFTRLAKEAGFDVIDKRFLSFEQNPFGFIQSVLNATRTAPRDTLFELLKGNRQLRGSRRAVAYLHALLSVPLTPIAIAEDLISSLLNRGATVEFTLQPTSVHV